MAVKMTSDYVRVEHDGWVDAHHPCLDVSINDAAPVKVCAYSWCTGRCGLPALTSADAKMKVFGPMTAVGPVLQRWRGEWKGEIIRLSEEDTAYLSTRFWW